MDKVVVRLPNLGFDRSILFNLDSQRNVGRKDLSFKRAKSDVQKCAKRCSCAFPVDMRPLWRKVKEREKCIVFRYILYLNQAHEG